MLENNNEIQFNGLGLVMNKETSYSDENLLRLARDGNINAFNSLLERYTHKIHQIIFLYINDPANAKDIAQEVLLKVYRNLDYFKEECQFSTWLYRITLNTIKNYFRSINQRLDSEAQFSGEQYSSYYYSPEHQLINMEFNEKIEYAVSRLSEELRICYRMHIFEGQTYEDIAKQMHCPIGTVRSRIYRARKLMMTFVGLRK